MYTNEVLDTVRQGKSRGELKAFYEDVRAAYPEGSSEHARWTRLINQKFGAQVRKEQNAGELKFVYTTMTLDAWKSYLKGRGIVAEEDGHFKIEEDCAYRNVNELSWPVDWDEKIKRKAEEIMADAQEGKPTQAQAKQQAKAALANEIAAHERAEPQWRVLRRRTLKNDKAMEDMQMRLKPDKTPDWYRTVRLIAILGETLGYDEIHYKHVLTRFVSHYSADMQSFCDDMEAKIGRAHV